MQSSGKIYIQRIDILRFVAATLVIFWHFIHFKNMISFSYVPRVFLFSIFEEGHTGVSLFMVLSGFIFQYINNKKAIIYPKFLKNRFFRIFPLAIFWILLSVCSEPSYDSVKVILNTLFLFNGHMVPSVGWTIVVEFQFYLIFPMLHKKLEEKQGAITLLALIGFMILIRTLLFINYNDIRDMVYWTIFGRMDQFLIGMLAAKLYTSVQASGFFFSPKTNLLRTGLFVIAILVTLLFFHAFNQFGGFNSNTSPAKDSIWILFHDCEGILYSAIIVLYLSLNLPALFKPVEALFAKLGEYSYSMYWIHFPIIRAIWNVMNYFHHNLTSFSSVFLTCLFIVVPIVCLVSAMSYYLIEKPFLSNREKYAHEI